MSFFLAMSRDNKEAGAHQPSRLRLGPGSARAMLLEICQAPGHLPTQGAILNQLVIPALRYVRQVELPTRPLGHVGADPPGVDIMSKLLIRTGAGGVAYAPGPGLPANVCVVLNEIRSLWIAFPAMEKAEFRANKDYETSCFFN